MEAAHPDAAAALGSPSFSANLGGRGTVWLFLVACVVTFVLARLFGPLWFLPVLVLIGVIIYTLVWMYRVSAVVSLHADGLAIRRGWRFLPYFGKRTDAFRWDEIAAVYRQLFTYAVPTTPRDRRRGNTNDFDYSGVFSTYQIVARDGRRLVLDSRLGEDDDVVRIADIIQREVRRRLLPGFFEQYDRGEPVAFGPLTLRQGGLTLGTHEYDWSAVVGLSVRKGLLTVEYTGAREWYSALAAIPNPDLFFAMLAERQADLWVAANPDQFAEQRRLWTGSRASRRQTRGGPTM